MWDSWEFFSPCWRHVVKMNPLWSYCILTSYTTNERCRLLFYCLMSTNYPISGKYVQYAIVCIILCQTHQPQTILWQIVETLINLLDVIISTDCRPLLEVVLKCQMQGLSPCEYTQSIFVCCDLRNSHWRGFRVAVHNCFSPSIYKGIHSKLWCLVLHILSNAKTWN